MPEPMEFDRSHSRGLDELRIFPLTKIVELKGVSEDVMVLTEVLPFLRKH